MIAMTLTSDNLVGYVRAEFAKASRLRVCMFFVQLAVAVPGAVSVIVDSRIVLYVLAIVGAALLLSWWMLNVWCLSAREASRAARRAALLLGGLNQPFSPSEIQSLKEKFTVNAVEAQARETKDYYATKLQPGQARLGEMLEQSAFYSAKLTTAQRHGYGNYNPPFCHYICCHSPCSDPFC